MTPKLLLLLVVIMVTGAPGSAEAAVLCANPSGSVFVRDACLSNENPLDLAAPGLAARDAYTYSRRGVPLTATATTVAQLSVDPGSYVILFYAFVNNVAGAPYNAPILCSFWTGGDYDLAAMSLQPFYSGNNISSGTLSLTSVAELPYGGSIQAKCYNNAGVFGNAEINSLRLTAVRVASLTRQ
jgi:hypothetical protein